MNDFEILIEGINWKKAKGTTFTEFKTVKKVDGFGWFDPMIKSLEIVIAYAVNEGEKYIRLEYSYKHFNGGSNGHTVVYKNLKNSQIWEFYR